MAQYTYKKQEPASETDPKGTIYGLFGIDAGYKYKMTSVNKVELIDGPAKNLKLTPIQYIITITKPINIEQKIYLNPDYSEITNVAQSISYGGEQPSISGGGEQSMSHGGTNRFSYRNRPASNGYHSRRIMNGL